MTDTAKFDARKAKALSAQCARLPNGKRRDWERLATLLNEHDQAHEDFAGTKRVAASADLWKPLDGFQRYVLLTMHHKAGRANGGGRTINLNGSRLKVPTSVGAAYQKKREHVFEAMVAANYTFSAGPLVDGSGAGIMFVPPADMPSRPSRKTKSAKAEDRPAAKTTEPQTDAKDQPTP